MVVHAMTHAQVQHRISMNAVQLQQTPAAYAASMLLSSNANASIIAVLVQLHPSIDPAQMQPHQLCKLMLQHYCVYAVSMLQFQCSQLTYSLKKKQLHESQPLSMYTKVYCGAAYSK